MESTELADHMTVHCGQLHRLSCSWQQEPLRLLPAFRQYSATGQDTDSMLAVQEGLC